MVKMYVAGLCNIGPEEIARRRRTGWIGLIVAMLLFGVLYSLGVDPWWRLFVFFPAALCASGFLQAHFQFCSGFARRGMYNFGPLGQANKVGDDESRRKDRKKGRRITFFALLIGALVALACVYL